MTDGIDIRCTEHPRGSFRLWLRNLFFRDLRKDSLETVEIELPKGWVESVCTLGGTISAVQEINRVVDAIKRNDQMIDTKDDPIPEVYRDLPPELIGKAGIYVVEDPVFGSVPTPEMIEAGVDAILDGQDAGDLNHQMARRIYEAMTRAGEELGR